METPKYISNIQPFCLRIATVQKQGTSRLLSTDCLTGPKKGQLRSVGGIMVAFFNI